jgi:hypothetical protein
MKQLLLIVVSILTLENHSPGQSTTHKYDATVLLDSEFKGELNLLESPKGKVLVKLKNNIKREDYILLKIKDEKAGMFYVSASYAMKGHIADGWIQKGNEISIFSRAYDQPLELYASPDPHSKVESVIKKYSPQSMKVVGCSGQWLRVETLIEGKKYSGWLSPDMQCANPYTTCN